MWPLPRLCRGHISPPSALDQSEWTRIFTHSHTYFPFASIFVPKLAAHVLIYMLPPTPLFYCCRFVMWIHRHSTAAEDEYEATLQEVKTFEKQAGRRPRILVAKMGQDGHDRGAKVIASGFSDMGYDVDVGPLFSTPDEVARQAVDSDVHVSLWVPQQTSHRTVIEMIVLQFDIFTLCAVTLHAFLFFPCLFVSLVFSYFLPRLPLSAIFVCVFAMQVVGVSSQAAGHKTLLPALIAALQQAGGGHIKVCHHLSYVRMHGDLLHLLSWGFIMSQRYSRAHSQSICYIYYPQPSLTRLACVGDLWRSHPSPRLRRALRSGGCGYIRTRDAHHPGCQRCAEGHPPFVIHRTFHIEPTIRSGFNEQISYADWHLIAD